MDRISRHKLPLKISDKDHIIFSSKTIPTPETELSKSNLVSRLRKTNVRIFDSIHVSGHGSREDLREMIELVKPEHFLPSNAEIAKTQLGAELAQSLGYKMNKTVHLLQNSKFLEIKG